MKIINNKALLIMQNELAALMDKEDLEIAYSAAKEIYLFIRNYEVFLEGYYSFSEGAKSIYVNKLFISNINDNNTNNKNLNIIYYVANNFLSLNFISFGGNATSNFIANLSNTQIMTFLGSMNNDRIILNFFGSKIKNLNETKKEVANHSYKILSELLYCLENLKTNDLNPFLLLKKNHYYKDLEVLKILEEVSDMVFLAKDINIKPTLNKIKKQIIEKNKKTMELPYDLQHS